jgi:hypothetical protein
VASIKTLPFINALPLPDSLPQFINALPLPDSSPQLTSTNGPTQVHKIHVTGGGMDPCLASHEMNTALQQPPDDDVIAYVWSIITSSLHFNTDIPLKEITAFVSRLCQPISIQSVQSSGTMPWRIQFIKEIGLRQCTSTFGCPKIPPSTVTVLPAVIVLKMVINAVKQINAHKVRICAHGGHQVQGRDFKESFAHTVLGRLIKIAVAVPCFLAWYIFHFDIHNALKNLHQQLCTRQRTHLALYQSNLAWLLLRAPSFGLASGTSPHQ